MLGLTRFWIMQLSQLLTNYLGLLLSTLKMMMMVMMKMLRLTTMLRILRMMI